MIEQACSACGRAAESMREREDSRGAVVLYEMSGGAPAAWYHSSCAASAGAVPAQTLAPIFMFPPTLLEKVSPYHQRKKAWEQNAYTRIRNRQVREALAEIGTASEPSSGER